jgi:uncharacterized protein (TIGR01244 family)
MEHQTMKTERLAIPFCLALLIPLGFARADAPAVPEVKTAELGSTPNVHACGNIFLAGQPAPDDLARLKEQGIKRVVTLRLDGELDWNDREVFEKAGLEFTRIGFRDPESLTDDVFDKVRQLLRQSDSTPTLLHCGSANRVGAVWLTHRVLDQGVAVERALEEAKTVGLRNPAYEEKALAYIKRQPETEPSVRPGINTNFLQPDLDVSEWIGRFEIESREVFAARNEVLQAIGLKPGARVADIGAGTGLYTRLFAEAVGPDGWVFAVDISPSFVRHISQRAHDDRLQNATAVLCPENSVSLPPDSVDVAFVCDTYHHFEYPRSTLASIRRALRPGGSLVLIDFERIPGASRAWIIDHVRAGKDEFRGEVEAAGFALVEEVTIAGFEENYFLRFQKR